MGNTFNFNGTVYNQGVIGSNTNNYCPDILLNELVALLTDAQDNEKILIEDAIAAITEKKEEKKVVLLLKKIASIGGGILSKISADVAVNYLRSNGIIP